MAESPLHDRFPPSWNFGESYREAWIVPRPTEGGAVEGPPVSAEEGRGS